LEQLIKVEDLIEKRFGKKRPYISRVENGEDLRISNFILIANAPNLSISLTAR
jgi:helix-turn-helix protein